MLVSKPVTHLSHRLSNHTLLWSCGAVTEGVQERRGTRAAEGCGEGKRCAGSRS